MQHGHGSYSLKAKRESEDHKRFFLLPVFFRYTRRGRSRFPPSCSGTPATSVCCSFLGLGSFHRPRSAASWAPRIGRRTKTGTYFNNTLTQRNNPPKTEKCYLKITEISEWGKIGSAGGDLKRLRRDDRGAFSAVYLRCSLDHLIRLLPVNTEGDAVTLRTRPPGILIKRRAAPVFYFTFILFTLK